MTYLLAALLAFVLAGWAGYLSNADRRTLLFGQDPFRPANWGMVEILGVFVLYAASVSLAIPLAQFILDWNFPPTATYHSVAATGTSSYSLNHPVITSVSLLSAHASATLSSLLAEERKLWLTGCSTLLSVLIATGLLSLATRSRAGWNFTSAGRDVKLACVASVLCLPTVFLVQAIVVQIPGMQYEHPLLRFLFDNPSPRLWMALGFTAIIVAPIAEEFFFRGLLQGWLEAKLIKRHEQLRQADDEQPSLPTAVEQRLPLQMACLPILGSSTLFSAAHFNHGGGWIAIFVLALGLGLLYHKTHRLLPCILLHMALNTASLTMAYFGTQIS